MTRPFRTAAAALLLAALAPAARAQSSTRVTVGSDAARDALTPQELDMLSAAGDFSRRCAESLERWIAAKETTQEKLFSAIYYPFPKTDPPKFTTDWDRLSDRDILPIEEGTLNRSGNVAFAVLVDKFGYLPSHNARYAQPLTGNAAVDLLNNRTKRIFNDRVGLLAARSTA